MAEKQTTLRGSAIYRASGVSRGRHSSWENRGVFDLPVVSGGKASKKRVLPAPQQGIALEYTLLDLCVLRLMRELFDLGLSPNAAADLANDARGPLDGVIHRAIGRSSGNESEYLSVASDGEHSEDTEGNRKTYANTWHFGSSQDIAQLWTGEALFSARIVNLSMLVAHVSSAMEKELSDEP